VYKLLISILIAPVLVHYEPVGRFYEAAVKRQRLDKSFSGMEQEIVMTEKETDKEDDIFELTFEEKQYLMTLDAGEWKVYLYC